MSADETAAGKATPGPARRRRGLLIAGVAAAVLAGGGGVAWTMLTGTEPPVAAEVPPVYILLDPIVVNLRSGDGRARLLRAKLAIEVADEAARDRVQQRLPALIDGMLTPLRELTPDDVTGAAGIYRIKEELQVRADAALGRGQVRRVLVQELVQQ